MLIFSKTTLLLQLLSQNNSSNMSDLKISKIDPIKRWFVYIMLLSTLFVGISIYSYKHYTQKAEFISVELSFAYSNIAANLLADFDRFAFSVVSDFKSGKIDTNDAKTILKHRKVSNPYIMDVLILNSVGEIEVWTREGSEQKPIVTDRSYYTFHQSQKSSISFVSEPNLSKVEEGMWFFAISRAIYEGDELLGVGVVIVDIKALERSFSRFVQDRYASVALIRDDGDFLLRSPKSNSIKSGTTIESITSSDLELHKKELKTLSLVQKDGDRRVVSLTPIEGYNLTSAGVVDIDNYFRDWRVFVYILFTVWIFITTISYLYTKKYHKIKKDKDRVARLYFEQLKRLENISKKLPVAIFEFRAIADERYEFSYLSEAFGAILGVSNSSVKKSWESIFTNIEACDLDSLKNSIDRAVNGRSEWREEFRVRDLQNRLVWLEGSALPSLEGDETYWYGYMIDISKRKLLEQNLREFNQSLRDQVVEGIRKSSELEDIKNTQDALLIQQSKLAEMGEMIGVIAHQWKQPISNLYMLIQVLPDFTKDRDISDKQVEDICKKIENQVMFMDHTINDFKNFLSPKREKSSFMIKESLDEIMCIVKPSLDRLKISLDVKVESDFLINGIKNEMKQIFLNLIKNSQDELGAHENRELKRAIYIRFSKREKFGVVEICDNGGGISKSLLPDRLFELHISTKSDKGGSGIGLYLVKKIVEEHFLGSIKAYNKESGACFEISFLSE